MARLLAQVNCPNCKQPFRAPLERIMDVDLDPTAKTRLLSGQVNMISCPHCGAAGIVSMPFLYHDASKELALVFMPPEAGRDDQERQQLIGSMTREVMNQLPPEKRKGYLLNPQVFLSLETLVNRVLEAEGITPEMIEAQKAKANLLRQMAEATPEERINLIRENEKMLDEEFFQIVQINIEQASAAGRPEMAQKMNDLYAVLLEQTAVGRRLAARSEAVQALQEQPTREKLLELLLDSDDANTRMSLIVMGQPLIDYLFFQNITQQIEATKDKAKQKRLENLRQELLDIREEMKRQAQQVVGERANLLRDLLATEQPELLARRHLLELDDIFFNVLATEAERARQEGNAEASDRLQKVWQLTIKLLQAQTPPGLRLLMQVLEKEPQEIRQVLEDNRQLVNAPFLQMLEQIEQQLRQQEEVETADKVAAALAVARTIASTEDIKQG